MCGRYAATARPNELVEVFEVGADRTDEPSAPVVKNPQSPPPGESDWNLAPSKHAPVVLTRAPRDEPDHPVRQLRLLTWGLVSPWAPDVSMGNRMINARSETLFEKRTFVGPAAKRRCLVPAGGWYEWQPSPVATTKDGKPRKQPFYMSRADGEQLAFAGLYEFHKPGGARSPGDWVVSFTILTQAAEPGMDRIHDRQPVVLDRERWTDWLDPAVTDEAHVRALLADQPLGRFQAWPVSAAVSRVTQNGPDLAEPIPREQLVGVLGPVTSEVVDG